MGTTITLALVYEGTAYVANVGDSRAYIWRAGKLHQITQDHSMAVMLAEMGMISKDEVATHPRRHTLCKSLGTRDQVEADTFEWDLQPGDRLLLCSDGLWQAFPDDEALARPFKSAMTPASLCRQLVSDACKRDGSDNISAVAVNIEPMYRWDVQDLGHERAWPSAEPVIA